jgi:anti-sigma B factor antagonist
MPDSAPKCSVQSLRHGRTLVLAVVPADVYQSETIEQLGHDLRAAIEAAPESLACVVDLSGVRFLSSAALGLMLNLNSQLGSHGVKFSLACAAGEVAEVFKRSRLEKALALYNTVAEAVASCPCP